MLIPFDLVIPPLGMYPTDIDKMTYIRTFIATLIIRAEDWEPISSKGD